MKHRSLSRRRAISLIIGASVPSLSRGASAPVDYSGDIEFLLTELEKKADHFFPGKGIDWRVVSAQFRTEARAVASDAAHVKVCNRLIARLRDGHAALVDLKVKFPDESGGRRFTGPRVHLVEIGDRVFVRQSFGAGVPLGHYTRR